MSAPLGLEFLTSAPDADRLPPSRAELAVAGRSNVGKSSLLNALLGVPTKRYASESRRPGHTRALAGWGVGDVLERSQRVGGRVQRVVRVLASRGGQGLVVVDAPGYGMRSREEWGVEVEKYLRGREV